MPSMADAAAILLCVRVLTVQQIQAQPSSQSRSDTGSGYLAH